MRRMTYISLFSSAGVGCYGFKMNDFDCIATNELLKVRIAVQKANKKCKYDSGYICGDITKSETHDILFKEIEMWREKEGLNQVDVVFATPPCQGMSTVNYKKNDHEQIRNSLVVQAIKIIREIHPKIFVFENVRAFLTSVCTDLSGEDMFIKQSIEKNLLDDYNIYYKVINFKDYGIPSSRPRTLVIGTSKKENNLSPLSLFPIRRKEITLREAIGNFTPLAFGEKDPVDPLHFARPFPKHEIPWISDLKEGQSAFDQSEEKQPYKIDDTGKRVKLKGSYMGNKYRRLFWDKPCACIATRNDVLSSQDTIHPKDNRVLSIRELMRLMTIPDSFKWTVDDDLLTTENSNSYLVKNEMNIRHCIGEAVPTRIISTIAAKIKTALSNEDIDIKKVDVSPAAIFHELNEKLNPNLRTVKIHVESTSGFEKYVPQVTAFYSDAENILIDVFAVDEQQLNTYLNILKGFDLGSNVIVRFNETDNVSEYDYKIGDNICSCEQVQLSLL